MKYYSFHANDTNILLEYWQTILLTQIQIKRNQKGKIYINKKGLKLKLLSSERIHVLFLITPQQDPTNPANINKVYTEIIQTCI